MLVAVAAAAVVAVVAVAAVPVPEDELDAGMVGYSLAAVGFLAVIKDLLLAGVVSLIDSGRYCSLN